MTQSHAPGCHCTSRKPAGLRLVTTAGERRPDGVEDDVVLWVVVPYRFIEFQCDYLT